MGEVKKHASSKAHTDLEANPQKQVTVPICFQNASRSISINDQVKEAEIRMVMFLTEHNISLNVADHMVNYMKTVDSKSLILQKMKCDLTKTTCIVKNVIGKYSKEEVINIARNERFSLIIDSSTDRTRTKHLAMVMRFEKNFESKDVFLGLLELSDATANGIFNSVLNFMVENGIPYKDNLIGFAADGENTMFGSNNSVVTKLKAAIPELFTMKCICHSLSLATSAASKELPDAVESLLSNIYNYMKNSSKRQINFELQQKILEVDPHKILKVCPTRWLSLNACVDRVLEQYDALFNYFKVETEGNIQAARDIYETMQNSYTRLYLEFLKFVLPFVVNKNKEFQSEKPKLYKLCSKMAVMYCSIVELYMKKSYLDKHDETTIMFKIPEHYKSIEEIYLGPEVMAQTQMLNQNSPNLKTFRVKCSNFLISLTSEIYQRFPFKEPHIRNLKYVDFMDPRNNIKNTVSIASVAKLYDKKANVDFVKADGEFRQLKNNFRGNDTKNVTAFWNQVNRCTNGGKKTYPNVWRLVKYILALPHSSATCERCFSQINLNKTKTRNKLETPTLRGLLYGKGRLHLHNKTCYNFVIGDMMKYHNQDMYRKENSK